MNPARVSRVLIRQVCKKYRVVLVHVHVHVHVHAHPDRSIDAVLERV
jgi:hypothetical protein